MSDRLKWHGVMKIRRLPEDWTPEDFAYWWLPREVYPAGHPSAGQVKVPSRMSQEEKEGLTVAQAPNTLLAAGVSNMLAYAIAQGAAPGVMFQYLGLGNGAIAGVLFNDTALASEYYRQVVTGTSSFGASGVISTAVTSGNGNGTITNIGLFGIAASGTANSGTLMSQILYLPPFVKASVAYTFDYEIVLTSN